MAQQQPWCAWQPNVRLLPLPRGGRTFLRTTTPLPVSLRRWLLCWCPSRASCPLALGAPCRLCLESEERARCDVGEAAARRPSPRPPRPALLLPLCRARLSPRLMLRPPVPGLSLPLTSRADMLSGQSQLRARMRRLRGWILGPPLPAAADTTLAWGATLEAMAQFVEAQVRAGTATGGGATCTGAERAAAPAQRPRGPELVINGCRWGPLHVARQRRATRA